MDKDACSWSAFQDNVLRELREQRKIMKWTSISKIMQEEYRIKGKNGKSCRERYFNFLNESADRQEWTVDEQKLLILLHNELGNRWVEIGKKLGREDNDVKNHYHSKLRKSFRKINKIIFDFFRGQFKPLKINILSKIIQTAEQFYKENKMMTPKSQNSITQLKNQILVLADMSEQQMIAKLQNIKQIIAKIQQINSNTKNKKVEQKQKDKQIHIKYKGKQIINLIQQNHKSQLEITPEKRLVKNSKINKKHNQRIEQRFEDLPPAPQNHKKQSEEEESSIGYNLVDVTSFGRTSTNQQYFILNPYLFNPFGQPYMIEMPFMNFQSPTLNIGANSSFSYFVPQQNEIKSNINLNKKEQLPQTISSVFNLQRRISNEEIQQNFEESKLLNRSF